ncbi:MAG: hypothetical protein AAFQ66_11115 [Pseudomonadota bacterium]
MSGGKNDKPPKGTGKESGQSLKTLLAASNWEQRVAEAREKREKVLASKGATDEPKPLRRPLGTPVDETADGPEAGADPVPLRVNGGGGLPVRKQAPVSPSDSPKKTSLPLKDQTKKVGTEASPAADQPAPSSLPKKPAEDAQSAKPPRVRQARLRKRLGLERTTEPQNSEPAKQNAPLKKASGKRLAPKAVTTTSKAAPKSQDGTSPKDPAERKEAIPKSPPAPKVAPASGETPATKQIPVAPEPVVSASAPAAQAGNQPAAVAQAALSTEAQIEPETANEKPDYFPVVERKPRRLSRLILPEADKAAPEEPKTEAGAAEMDVADHLPEDRFRPDYFPLSGGYGSSRRRFVKVALLSMMCSVGFGFGLALGYGYWVGFDTLAETLGPEPSAQLGVQRSVVSAAPDEMGPFNAPTTAEPSPPLAAAQVAPVLSEPSLPASDSTGVAPAETAQPDSSTATIEPSEQVEPPDTNGVITPSVDRSATARPAGSLAARFEAAGTEVNHIRIYLYAPESVDSSDLVIQLAQLENTGFEVAEPQRVNLIISQPHIRYYNIEDTIIALALARNLGIEARDFTQQTSGSRGRIEVWLDGTARSQRASGGTGGGARQTARARTGPRPLQDLRRFRDHVIRKLQ